MPGIPLTEDEQDQFNKEFGTNSYVSPSTASKSAPLTGAETNEVLDEFAIKPDSNNYIPPEVRNMGEDTANSLRQSAMVAEQTTPDQAVKDVKMSNDLSIPAEYFMTDPDMREQVAEAFNNKKSSSIDWDGIAKQYPTLSQFLSDPKNMATAKDLIPELATQEQHFQNIKQVYPGSTIGPDYKYKNTTIGSRQPSWWETVKQMAYSGAAQFNQGMYGLGRLPIEAIFGSNNSVVKWLNERSAESQAVMDTAEQESQAMKGVKKLAYIGGSATVNMVPTVLMGAMTGGAAEAPTLGGEASLLLKSIKDMIPFGVQSVGQYAEQAKQEGASVSQQAAYGLYGGSVEMVTELPFVRDYIAMTGSKEIVQAGIKNIVKEFGKAGWDFLKNTAEETVQEVITTPLTQAVKKTLYQPDMPFFGDNGVISVPQAESDAYGAFAMTTVMHAMGLPFSSHAHQMAQAIIETGRTPNRSQVIALNNLAQPETPHAETNAAINEAKDNADIYKKTGEMAAKSKYLDRLPEAWRTLVEASTQGGKLENIYIDPEPFVALMQSMAPEGTDPGLVVQEVAKELGINDQLQEATQTGKPLSIPYATWLEKTAKTPIYKKLEGDIKFSADGLTLNQAAVEEERVKKAIEEEQKQAKIQNTNYESIYNDIKDKLVSAGRSEREAKYSAQVFASRMVAEGSRRQVNPLELYMGMMQPEIYNVDFMPNQVSPDILGKLNDNERAFIETLAAQNKPVEQIQKGIQEQYNKILNEQIKYLNESGGKGVQQGSLITDALGNVINRIGRQSNNPKWYRDFYTKNGRKPSQRELRELAIKQLKEGYSEDTDNIPGNNEFIQLENTIKGINDLKGKIDRLMGNNRLGQEGNLNQSSNNLDMTQIERIKNGETIPYYRNLEKSPYMGSQFGQDIEPTGEYMGFNDNPIPGFALPNYEYGNISFENPLIMEYKTTGHGGWKTDLSQKYKGLVGKKLTAAIKKEGYDSIITYDSDTGNVREMVNLGGNKSEAKKKSGLNKNLGENQGFSFDQSKVPQQINFDDQLKAKVKEMTPEELVKAVYSDRLTGLYNRAAYEMATSNPETRLPFQTMFDLNGFKFINDSMGHEAGDEVLKAISDLTQKADIGPVFRLGGDEFTFQSNSLEEAQAKSQKLQNALDNSIIEVEDNNGRKIKLKGVTFGVGHGEELRSADAALENNKREQISGGIRPASRGDQPPGLHYEIAGGGEIRENNSRQNNPERRSSESINPTQSKEPGSLLYQTNAWHGSPHDFEKFMLDHIGSGEGQQAYGWGLYFAGKKEIADWYREELSQDHNFPDYEKYFDDFYDKHFDEANKLISTYERNRNSDNGDLGGHLGAFLAEVVDTSKEYIKQHYDIDDSLIKFIKDNVKSPESSKGKLFEVSLTPNEEDFLDWDKSLTDQSDKVKKGIQSIASEYPSLFKNYDSMTGEDLYTKLVDYYINEKDLFEEEAKEKASKYLNLHDIPGIKYLDATSRKDGEGSHNYVIFDNNAVKVINKYYQDARANVQINPDQSIITLFSKADASSFLHESSHLFLEDTFQYVKSGQADENYMKDWKTLSNWLAIKGDQDKLTTDQQEQFARGFESYLMEGKAPSEGLRKAFAAFRRWLTRIYKSVSGLNVQLSDEVRGVMDRMLATEDEIQEREAADGYLMDFIDEKSATSDALEKLRDLKTKAHEMAVEALLKPQMDELKPSHEELLQAERDRVTPIIEEEVAKSPIYQVMEAIKQTFGMQKDVKDLASRYLQNGEITNEGIARWEAIADAFGYSSGDQLARDIMGARNFSEEVNDRLAVHMSQFGELKDSPQELQFMAERALHNDEQLSALAMEREMLTDLIHQENAKANKKQWNMQRARIAAEAARRYAKTTIADKNYREAAAATAYFAAERNAAVKESQSYAKKDIRTAAQYADQRMLNHALAMEALKVRQEVDRAFKYIEKWQKNKRPEIAKEHLGQIDHILGRFGLQGPNAVTQEEPLADWIKAREEYDEAAIPDFIADETIQKPYKDLTLSELRDVVDAIKNIDTVARNEKKLLTDEQQRNLDLIIEDMVGSMQQNKRLFPQNYDPNKAPGEMTKHWGRGFVASHQKVEWIARALDGYKDQGPAWHYIVLPMLRGLDKEYKMRREAGEKLTDIIRNYYGNDTSQLARKKISIKGTEDLFPRGLTKENVLAMALNWGNEGNRQRLVDSYYDTENQENLASEDMFQDIFDQVLDKNDWDFVQNVWDFIDSYWPQIAQDKKTRTGVEPIKIEASIVNTKYGDYRGGYYPVVYDPSKNEKAFRQAEEESIKELFNLSYLKPSTRRGFEKQRVQAVVGRPLDLHLSVIDNHLATVIHSVSFSNGIRDVDKVLNSGRVTKVIKETMSDEVYKQFRPWLQGIARDNKDMATVGPWAFAENILRRARIGSSVVNMGIKFTTAFSQLAGIIPVMERIGPTRTLGGVLDFYYKAMTGKAGEEINFVFGKSEMMKNRMNNRDRDIRDATRRMIDSGTYDEIKDTYFALTGLFDYAVTMPSWIQAYNQHIGQQMKSGKEINDEMAIRYADQVVRDTQGSGDIVNMAGIQRGSEWYKALTQFYSYFSVYANRQIEAFQRAKRNGEYGQLISFAAYWWFMPALVSELLSGRWGGGGDDDDDTVKWLLSTILKYPAGAFVLARDAISPAIDKMFGTGRGDVDLVPSADAFAKATQFLGMLPGTIQGDIKPEKLLKSGFEAGGYWLHYPSKQISTTVGNIYDSMVNGEDFYLRDLVFPKPGNRR
ncbi:MAG TPA: hypothetical protein DDW50_20955 [Firmicutes bacterium]|jgi:diguanylate cyclase (GGDEF)-like protein|nr:hypothetical protein [Bacillota bacterium]